MKHNQISELICTGNQLTSVHMVQSFTERYFRTDVKNSKSHHLINHFMLCTNFLMSQFNDSSLCSNFIKTLFICCSLLTKLWESLPVFLQNNNTDRVCFLKKNHYLDTGIFTKTLHFFKFFYKVIFLEK